LTPLIPRHGVIHRFDVGERLAGGDNGRFRRRVLDGGPLENRPNNVSDDQLYVGADHFTVATFILGGGAERHVYAANDALLLLLGIIAACNIVGISVKAIAGGH
jgi:hypothetical protein